MPSIQVVPPVKVVLTPVGLQTFDVVVSAPNPVVQVLSEGPQGPVGPTGAQGPAGEGVPTGGSAGEVLVKQSATDYDLGYGVRAETWRPLSGFYYGPFADSTATGTLNRVMVFPVYFSVPVAVDSLRCEVTAGGAAGSVVRMGIYLPGSDGKPNSLLVDAGTVDATSPGIKIASISETVSGLIWVAAVAQGALPTTRRAVGLSIPYEYGRGVAAASLNLRTVLFSNSVTGALDATFNNTNAGISGMAVQVGVA